MEVVLLAGENNSRLRPLRLAWRTPIEPIADSSQRPTGLED